MVQAATSLRPRRRLPALIGLLALAGVLASPVQARPRHAGSGESLLRCASLRPAGAAGRSRAGLRAFAPTSQAVFLSHAGDRCVWHSGRRARS